MFDRRDGETPLAVDPADMAPDGGIVFIGVVRSPWQSRETCPKNMRAAREAALTATIDIAPVYRPGLTGLVAGSHIVLLTWLDRAPRNLIIQKPRHASRTKGVFALRSPARPNPIGMHVALLTAIDVDSGQLSIDAVDVLDGTPVIDIKPYFPSVDAFPDALSDRPAEAP